MQATRQAKILPRLPPSFPLYLGITATAISFEHFCQLHPELVTSLFVDRTMAAASEIASPPETTERLLWSRDNGEADVVAGILSELLQDVIGDPSFVAAAAATDACPPPFYCQLQPQPGADGTGTMACSLSPLPPFLPRPLFGTQNFRDASLPA